MSLLDGRSTISDTAEGNNMTVVFSESFGQSQPLSSAARRASARLRVPVLVMAADR